MSANAAELTIAGIPLAEHTSVAFRNVVDAFTHLENLHGTRANAPPFVTSIRAFAGRALALHRSRVRTQHFRQMADFAAAVFPDADAIHFGLRWDEISIMRASREIAGDGLAAWLREASLARENFGTRDPQSGEPRPLTPEQAVAADERDAHLAQLAVLLRERLLHTGNLSIYPLANEGNENTGTSPNILIGDIGVAVVLRRWIL